MLDAVKSETDHADSGISVIVCIRGCGKNVTITPLCVIEMEFPALTGRRPAESARVGVLARGSRRNGPTGGCFFEELIGG